MDITSNTLVWNLPSSTRENLKTRNFWSSNQNTDEGEIFLKPMNEIKKKQTWTTFKCLTENFLRNKNDPKHRNIIETFRGKFVEFGCIMSVKMHLMLNQINYFPENLGHCNEEHGVRFNQDIKDVENRYQIRCNVNMMADYYWVLKRAINDEGGSA